MKGFRNVLDIDFCSSDWYFLKEIHFCTIYNLNIIGLNKICLLKTFVVMFGIFKYK